MFQDIFSRIISELPGFYGHFNIAHGWGGGSLERGGPNVVIININKWSNHGQISNHNKTRKRYRRNKRTGGGGSSQIFVRGRVRAGRRILTFAIPLYTFPCPKRLAQIRITCQCENPSGYCANISTKSFLLNETTSLENQSMGRYKLMQILIHLA